MTVQQCPIHRPGSPESAFDESLYAGFAAAQFRILKDYMALAGLNTYSRVVTLANGVVITCKKSFNREDIYIHVPTIVGEDAPRITVFYYYMALLEYPWDGDSPTVDTKWFVGVPNAEVEFNNRTRLPVLGSFTFSQLSNERAHNLLTPSRYRVYDESYSTYKDYMFGTNIESLAGAGWTVVLRGSVFPKYYFNDPAKEIVGPAIKPSYISFGFAKPHTVNRLDETMEESFIKFNLWRQDNTDRLAEATFGGSIFKFVSHNDTISGTRIANIDRNTMLITESSPTAFFDTTYKMLFKQDSFGDYQITKELYTALDSPLTAGSIDYKFIADTAGIDDESKVVTQNFTQLITNDVADHIYRINYSISGTKPVWLVAEVSKLIYLNNQFYPLPSTVTVDKIKKSDNLVVESYTLWSNNYSPIKTPGQPDEPVIFVEDIPTGNAYNSRFMFFTEKYALPNKWFGNYIDSSHDLTYFGHYRADGVGEFSYFFPKGGTVLVETVDGEKVERLVLVGNQTCCTYQDKATADGPRRTYSFTSEPTHLLCSNSTPADGVDYFVIDSGYNALRIRPKNETISTIPMSSQDGTTFLTATGITLLDTTIPEYAKNFDEVIGDSGSMVATINNNTNYSYRVQPFRAYSITTLVDSKCTVNCYNINPYKDLNLASDRFVKQVTGGRTYYIEKFIGYADYTGIESFVNIEYLVFSSCNVLEIDTDNPVVKIQQFIDGEYGGWWTQLKYNGVTGLFSNIPQVDGITVLIRNKETELAAGSHI